MLILFIYFIFILFYFLFFFGQKSVRRQEKNVRRAASQIIYQRKHC